MVGSEFNTEKISWHTLGLLISINHCLNATVVFECCCQAYAPFEAKICPYSPVVKKTPLRCARTGDISVTILLFTFRL